MKLVANHFKLYFVIPETKADAWRTMACQWEELARRCRFMANQLADRDREEVLEADDDEPLPELLAIQEPNTTNQTQPQ